MLRSFLSASLGLVSFVRSSAPQLRHSITDAPQCILDDKDFDYGQFYKQIVDLIYDELARPVPEDAPEGTRNAGRQLMDWWNE